MKIENSKLKILICAGIFPPEIGGPATYARALASELVENFEVVVLTYSSAFKIKDDKKLPYKVVRVWKKWPKLLRYPVFLLKTLINARSANSILSLNALSAGVPSVIISKILRKKLSVKIVGDRAWETAAVSRGTDFLINDFQNFKKRGRAGRIHFFQRWVCKKSDFVIVPSVYLAGLVKGWGGIEEEKIKVIHNGSDFKVSGLPKEEARKKIGIPGNIILTVGRMVPWKGFKMLIKIMPELLKINQFLRLVIVGEGPERAALEAMVKNMGLERKVYLVGKKTSEDLAVYLAAADIFVLNTAYEGFSHQILEAMRSNVPVVTTTAGGNKEIIKQGDNGFMVKYNDEFNLIEAIKTLWQNADIREEFTKNGKKTADKFSMEKMVGETIKLLNL